MENLQNIRTVEGLKQEILNKLQAEKEKQMEDIVPENMGSVEIEENKSFIKEFVSGESCIHGVRLYLGRCYTLFFKNLL